MFESVAVERELRPGSSHLQIILDKGELELDFPEDLRLCFWREVVGLLDQSDSLVEVPHVRDLLLSPLPD